MTSPSDLAAWLDDQLDANRFRTEEPENGLILDVGRRVRTVAASVNTTFESIAMAADAGAELLMVHHPSWPHIDLHLHESKVAALRDAGISLYGAHASLDGAALGTAKALADLTGVSVEGRFAEYHGALAGVHGTYPGSLDAFIATIGDRLGWPPEVERTDGNCGRVGIVTGAGGLTGWLDEARRLGCDTYLTGEGSMFTRLFARESGINLVLAGHDLTETPGIEALGRRVADHFAIEFVPVREPHLA